MNLEHPKNVLFNVRKKKVKLLWKAQKIEAKLPELLLELELYLRKWLKWEVNIVMLTLCFIENKKKRWVELRLWIYL